MRWFGMDHQPLPLGLPPAGYFLGYYFFTYVGLFLAGYWVFYTGGGTNLVGFYYFLG